jgi:glycosyltransferase involved in cell wall biosynthesis
VHTDVQSRARILHVINNLATGGAESMLARLAAELREEFDQTVVCLLDRGVLAPRLEALGIPVLALGSSARVPNPFVTLKLARRLRTIQPDIIQTWLYQSDLVGGLAARIAGYRNVVWNLRAADLSPSESHPLTRVIVRLCAALSSRVPATIVCCAESVAEVHRRIGYDLDRMVVICNGVDLTRFRPDAEARIAVRAELELPPGAVLIGHIARLHPQKDHETFFAAAHMLRQARSDVHFVLAGQRIHAREPQIEALLGRHAIDGGMHFLGERHDIPRILAALDLATSSSSWGEGFPNVLCEAMACGVPCVATDAGDAKLILGDTGRVVARRDAAALCSAWLHFLSLDGEARSILGHASRDRVARHYDQRMSTERYARLYRQLHAAGH